MILAQREFNHEVENFHQSLNISNDVRVRCRERIMFTAISNALQRLELFEDEDDAPKCLRTVSGDLQRCLRLITDGLEYEYTLMIFNHYQRLAMESFAYYKHIREGKLSKEDQLKAKILEMVEEYHQNDDEEDDEDNLLINKINKKTMSKRIDMIKNSHHNFDTYLNLLYRWSDGGYAKNTTEHKKSRRDIDDMLNNLFSNDED